MNLAREKFIVNNPIGVGAGGSSTTGQYIEKTYTQLSDLIDNSSLVPGKFYKITDRFNYQKNATGIVPNKDFLGDDRGFVYVQALTTNTLSKEAIRVMACPATYFKGVPLIDGQPEYLGVFHQDLLISGTGFGDPLTIWGGKVWKNNFAEPRVIGVPINDLNLSTDWTEVLKNGGTVGSVPRSPYVDLQFSVLYDFANDWFEKQWDGKNNIVGFDYYYSSDYEINFNPCDITDWNMEAGRPGNAYFYNNLCLPGIYNNSAYSISIFDNQIFDSLENGIKNNSSVCITGNNSYGIKNNNCLYIQNNHSAAIADNQNTGAITNNNVGRKQIIGLPNTIESYLDDVITVAGGGYFELDISGLSTIDLGTISKYISVVLLKSTNVTESINLFSSLELNKNVRFYVEPGLTVTFVNGTGVFEPHCEGGVNAVLDGANDDWIDFEQKEKGVFQSNIGTY